MKYAIIILLSILAYSCGKKNNISSEIFHESYEHACKMVSDGNGDPANNLMDSVYNICNQLDNYNKYLFLNFKAFYHIKKENNKKAFQYTDSALRFFDHHPELKKHSKDYLHTLMEMGHLLYNEGKYDSAYIFYSKVYVDANKLTDRSGIHEYYYEIAMNLYKQGRFHEAIIFFENCFTSSAEIKVEKLKPYYNMQEVLSNIGLCYYNQKKYDSAISYYDSAISFIFNNTDHLLGPQKVLEAKSVAFQNKATCLMFLGKYDSCEALLLNTKRLIIENNGDKKIIFKTNIKLSSLYTQAGWFNKTQKILDELKNSIDSVNGKRQQYFYLEQLYQYHEKTGAYKNALESYKEFINTYFLVFGGPEKTPATDMLRDVEVRENRYKIKLLEKDARFNKTWLGALVGFTFLIGIIAAILLYYYRKTNKIKQRLAKSYEQIQTQKTALEKSHMEKDEIMKMVAHDLRDPIGGAVYLTNFVLTKHELSPEVSSSLKLIHKTLIDSIGIIDDLHMLNADRTDGLEIATNMNCLIENVIGILQPKFSEKKLNYKAEIPDYPILVQIITDEIKRVVLNIITNAIKFSFEGGNIMIKLSLENNNMHFMVTDDGIGIPESMQESIFDPSTKFKRPGTAGEKSHGLGLSICKRIVSRYGGKIWVECPNPAGATFHVTLPIKNNQ